MKFEIKNFLTVPPLRNGPSGFSATLWADGKKAANILDRGDDGFRNWNWLDQPAKQAFLAEAKAAYPRETCEHEDLLLSRMIDRLEHITYLRRKTKNSLLYRLKGGEPGVWKTYKLKNTTFESLREHVRKCYGDKVEMIANDDIEAAVDFDLASTPDPYDQMPAQFPG